MKRNSLLVIALILLGASAHSAETLIPSSQILNLNKDAAEVDGMPMEIQFNHNKCAADQVSAIRETLKQYAFRKDLENIGIKKVSITVIKKKSIQEPKATISKDRSILYIESYPFMDRKWTKSSKWERPQPGGYTTEVDTSHWEYVDGDCFTFESKDLTTYIDQVKGFLAEKEKTKETQQLNNVFSAPKQVSVNRAAQ